MYLQRNKLAISLVSTYIRLFHLLSLIHRKQLNLTDCTSDNWWTERHEYITHR